MVDVKQVKMGDPVLFYGAYSGRWEPIGIAKEISVADDETHRWKNTRSPFQLAPTTIGFEAEVDTIDIVSQAEEHWRKVLGDSFYETVVGSDLEVDESAFDYGDVPKQDNA